MEEKQLEVQSLIFSSSVESLDRLCKFFNVEFKGIKSLLIVKKLCQAVEEEVAKLQDGEMEAYLEDVKGLIENTGAKADSKTDAKIDSKTDAKVVNNVQDDNTVLKMLSSSALRRQFKINGQIGDPDQRDKLSYTSLVRQILNGESQGYTESEIVDGVIRAITPAKMTTVVCDPVKIPLLLQRCENCPTLKNIIKLKGELKEEDRTKADESGIKIIEFDDLEKMGRENQHEKKLPKPKDLAVVCYTSGTTGNPKGAMISHGNVIAMLSGLVVLIEKCGIQVDNNDVHISYLPLAHMYERLAQLLCFMCGGRVGFFGGNIRKIMEDLQELKPTLFISVPRVLNRVYDKVIKEVSGSKIKKFVFNTAFSFKKAELDRNIIRKNSIWDYLVFRKIQNSLGGRVRFVISGSAPLRDDVMTFLRCALGCIVLEGYGQTESTAASTIQLLGDNTFGHVGPPMPCNKIKLVDVPDMNYFAKDGKGEICFYGFNVFQGYLHQPDKTKEAIDEDGWLHSGDIGEWTENGTIKIIDRKKHIFKLAQGEYIAPEKIEAVYMQCFLVNQVYVYGNSLKSCIVAIVVPDEAHIKKWAAKNGVEEELEALCKNEKVRTTIFDEMIAMGKKEKLFSFQQVKAIYLHPDPFSVENGLLTPTLKFKRPDIQSHFKDTFDDMYSKISE